MKMLASQYACRFTLIAISLGFALTGPSDASQSEGELVPPLETMLHGLLKTDV